ncbi:MAG: hypothetical protein ACI8XD_001312 [Thermoproteota archaeon]|jgi:hypothetical protein
MEEVSVPGNTAKLANVRARPAVYPALWNESRLEANSFKPWSRSPCAERLETATRCASHESALYRCTRDCRAHRGADRLEPGAT